MDGLQQHDESEHHLATAVFAKHIYSEPASGRLMDGESDTVAEHAVLFAAVALLQLGFVGVIVEPAEAPLGDLVQEASVLAGHYEQVVGAHLHWLEGHRVEMLWAVFAYHHDCRAGAADA